MEQGNLSNVKSVGSAVFEYRIRQGALAGISTT
jgi:putative component of toxin-antitoxin plasmid stabilization module